MGPFPRTSYVTNGAGGQIQQDDMRKDLANSD